MGTQEFLLFHWRLFQVASACCTDIQVIPGHLQPRSRCHQLQKGNSSKKPCKGIPTAVQFSSSHSGAGRPCLLAAKPHASAFQVVIDICAHSSEENQDTATRLHPRHELCKAEGSPLHLQCTSTAEHRAIPELAFPLWRESKACLLYSLSHTASYITNLFKWWITGLHITFVWFMCHCESNREMKASFLGQIKAIVWEGLDFFNKKYCSKIAENSLNEFEALAPQEGSKSMKLLKRAQNYKTFL